MEKQLSELSNQMDDAMETANEWKEKVMAVLTKTSTVFYR